METVEKLNLLAHDAQYDLACACGTSSNDDHRKRGDEGHWLYPVTVPGGGTGIMLKTLVTNMCTSDCGYCPLRLNGKGSRLSLLPDELAAFFIDLTRKRRLIGIFISSGILDTPDRSMQLLIATAEILRYRYHYRGHIHIKIIPGASDEAIRKAVSLASAVSLNIETPGERYFSKLSSHKDYLRDIISPLKLMSSLTAKGTRYSRVSTTSQFIVGASDEQDKDILAYMWGLYSRLNFSRLYFSSYQQGLGLPSIPGEMTPTSGDSGFVREHRLYQSDFLMRKYGFTLDDIPLNRDGSLDLVKDPKQLWADSHPEFYPVSLNRAPEKDLLKVPGIGPTLARRIITERKEHKLRELEQIKIPNHLKKRAACYFRE